MNFTFLLLQHVKSWPLLIELLEYQNHGVLGLFLIPQRKTWLLIYVGWIEIKQVLILASEEEQVQLIVVQFLLNSSGIQMFLFKVTDYNW